MTEGGTAQPPGRVTRVPEPMTRIRSRPSSRWREASTRLCSWSAAAAGLAPRRGPAESPRHPGRSATPAGPPLRTGLNTHLRAGLGPTDEHGPQPFLGRASGFGCAITGGFCRRTEGSFRRARGAGSSPATESGSGAVRSSPAAADSLEDESRRSHRGMSTPAQMATMATYSIALLSGPPLGVAGAGRPGGGFHGPWGAGTLLKRSTPT